MVLFLYYSYNPACARNGIIFNMLCSLFSMSMHLILGICNRHHGIIVHAFYFYASSFIDLVLSILVFAHCLCILFCVLPYLYASILLYLIILIPFCVSYSLHIFHIISILKMVFDFIHIILCNSKYASYHRHLIIYATNCLHPILYSTLYTSLYMQSKNHPWDRSQP